MLYNKELKEVNIQHILNDRKKVILFGASKGNRHIQDLLKTVEISHVFDNDSGLWGQMLYGVRIEEPKYVENAVVLTAVLRYEEVLKQLEALGIYDMYFYLNDEIYRKRLAISKYFTVEDFKFTADGSEKYIHIIPDQKFVLPLFHILQTYFNPYEHLVLIHNLEGKNPNNLYGSWEKYKEWKEKYHNVYIVDDYVNTYLYNWTEKLHELDEIILKCNKIIFHGEWLCDVIDGFFSFHRKALLEKAVWIPWSATFGKDEINMAHMNKVLKYVRGIAVYGDQIDYIKKHLYMYSYEIIDTSLSYVQEIERPPVIKKKTNVLVSHSCYSYDHVLEALYDLEHFNGMIEVYCITSYGHEQTIAEAKQTGSSIYGDHFHPVDQFMKYSDYVQFLSEMDVAYFAEEIAAGYNTTMLMFWLGVKVYFKEHSQPYETYRNDGFYVHDYYAAKQQSIHEFFNNDYEEENCELGKLRCAGDEQKKNWKKVLEYDWS